MMWSDRDISRRVGMLDELRGFCLVLMIAYHGAYDIIYIFGVDIPAFHWTLLYVAQKLVAGIFILISGICCRFSRSNIRRGFIALGVGLVMTLATWLVMPDEMILFGILHFMGAAMIIFGLIKPFLDRIKPAVGLCVMLVLMAVSWGVADGYLGLFEWKLIALPAGPYETQWMFWLGFPRFGFSSADYFPLLPWLFCFLSGSFIGVYFQHNRMPQAFYPTRIRPLAAIGRRSLIVYVLHQPVLYGVLWVFFTAGRALQRAIGGG